MSKTCYLTFELVTVLKQMELATKLKDGRLSYASVKEREEYSFALEVMVTISEALAWDNTITKVWDKHFCCFTNVFQPSMSPDSLLGCDGGGGGGVGDNFGLQSRQ